MASFEDAIVCQTTNHCVMGVAPDGSSCIEKSRIVREIRQFPGSQILRLAHDADCIGAFKFTGDISLVTLIIDSCDFDVVLRDESITGGACDFESAFASPATMIHMAAAPFGSIGISVESDGPWSIAYTKLSLPDEDKRVLQEAAMTVHHPGLCILRYESGIVFPATTIFPATSHRHR